MKTKANMNAIDYPRLESQPKYKAAADKLAQFVAERSRLQRELESLEAARYARLSAPLADPDAIKQGEAVLAGAEANTEAVQIEGIRHALRLLRNAIEAQEMVVRSIEGDLSRKAAERFIDEHKAIVMRQIDAVLELHEATEAERRYLNEFEELGYRPSALPARYFHWVSVDPHDEFGATYAWLKETRAYVGDTGEKQQHSTANWFGKKR